MDNIFSFTKIAQLMKTEIPSNIRIGHIENQLLSEVSPALMKKVIPQLKKEFAESYKDIINTQEKLEHVLLVLDKILMQKYNFAKQNIQQGEKFNQFYPEDKIDLPEQERNFQCVYCNQRSFKTNASLHSHYRSCQGKMNEQNSDQQKQKKEKTEGLKPMKIKGPKQTEIQAIKVFAAGIIQQSDETKKEKDHKDQQGKGKRSRPGSSCSLGSDIFYDQ